MINDPGHKMEQHNSDQPPSSQNRNGLHTRAPHGSTLSIYKLMQWPLLLKSPFFHLKDYVVGIKHTAHKTWKLSQIQSRGDLIWNESNILGLGNSDGPP